MELFSLLIYLNRISLVIFFILIIFISYQFYLLKKETKNKQEKIEIPEFKEEDYKEIKNYTSFSQTLNKDKLSNKENSFFLIILIFLSLVAVVLFILINEKLKSLEKEKIIDLKETISPTIVSKDISKITEKETEVNQYSDSLSPSPTITPSLFLSLSPTFSLSPSPSLTISLLLTKELEASPTSLPISLSPSPTEEILAIVSPSLTSAINYSPTMVAKTSPTSAIISQLPLSADMRSSFIILASIFLILIALII